MNRFRLIIEAPESPIRQALRYLGVLLANPGRTEWVPGVFGGLGVRVDGGRVVEFVEEARP